MLPPSESAPLAACELFEHSLSGSDADSPSWSASSSVSVAESVPASDSESEPESDALEPCDQLWSEASEASVPLPGSNALGLHCVAPGESGALSVRRRLPGIALPYVHSKSKVVVFFIFHFTKRCHVEL
jgi:hypothetical protein